MTKNERDEKISLWESAEAAGRLMVLPCDMGERIWIVVLKASKLNHVGAYIKASRLTPGNVWRACREFGRFVFLTLEEAEKAQRRIMEEGVEKVYADYWGG